MKNNLTRIVALLLVMVMILALVGSMLVPYM